MGFEEKRQWQRVDKKISVDVAVIDPAKSDSPFYLDVVWTKDVGANGLGLVTSVHCMVGSKIKVKFQLPGREKPIEALGTVVWSQLISSTPKKQYRVGITFDSIQPADHRAIMDYVHEEAKKTTARKNS